MKKDKKIAIIVLAAGASRRLGQPKQLVKYHGESLLRRMIKACQLSQLGPVHVVLGAKAAEIQKNLVDLDNLSVSTNPNWSQGMGNTIAFAAQTILLPGDFQAVCFVLSDQIYFAVQLLRELYAEYERSGKKIIISKYKTGQGPPSLFDHTLFGELAKLNEDDGAKKVVKKNADSVSTIDFPLGHLDVDTPEDLEDLR